MKTFFLKLVVFEAVFILLAAFSPTYANPSMLLPAEISTVTQGLKLPQDFNLHRSFSEKKPARTLEEKTDGEKSQHWDQWRTMRYLAACA